ncbi:MAG: hypothetical protein Q7T74_03370 [Candidatus Saccharibacteria bacterium]|nr:hypothetical protein [Candidatus Saccharibacteria bacterium]
MAAEKLIVSTLEPVEVGDTFPSLPLHVTLMPWFKIEDKNVRELQGYLRTIARKHQKLDLIGQDEAMFGSDHDVRVRILANEVLQLVHNDILLAMKWSQARCDSEYIDTHYSPHVSFVGNDSLPKGEIKEVTAMQLIDRDPETRTRKVEKIFGFGVPLKSSIKD